MSTRREQYTDSTRTALLDTGLHLFVERGFTAVPAEELVRAAGLTRGALYHHFDGKQGLFAAIFEDLEAKAAQQIVNAMAAVEDLWRQAETGLETFLDVCADENYRQIVLLQGPIALGWQRWRELDQHHLGGILLDHVRALVDAGLIQRHPPELIAAAMYGALTELSLATTDREQTSHLAHSLLTGLRPAGI